MALKLQLTRDQLANFLTDHQRIKQFEKLFSLTEEYLNTGMIDGIAVEAGNALALANELAAGIQLIGDALSKAPPPADTTALEARLAGLEALASQLDAATLESRLQALECLPPPKQHRNPRYGSFSDSTTQAAAAINTAYPIAFNTTDLSNGVYLGSPTSRIYVDTANVYNIQFSAQVDLTSGATSLVWFWLRHNGTLDVPDSTGKIRIQGNDSELVASWNYLIELNAGDFVELMWETDDTSAVLLAEGASAVHPAIPSVIVTVSDNISALGV